MTATIAPTAADSTESPVSLAADLAQVAAVVPPLWPLDSYVAVNPFIGLAAHRFLDARRTLTAVRNCEMLPTFEHFRSLRRDGRLAVEHLAAALDQCRLEHPDWYADRQVAHLVEQLEADSNSPLAGLPSDASARSSERRYRTVAELVDAQSKTDWSNHVINDISRHCASHYDQGQANWSSPWRGASLYQAWRESAQISRRMEWLGLPGFRRFVAGLPADPVEAVEGLLTALEVRPSQRRAVLLCELFSAAGWASFIRRLDSAAAADGRSQSDLTGLLAIRLAYDVAIARTAGRSIVAAPWQDLPDERFAGATDEPLDSGDSPAPACPPADVLDRYALLTATEIELRSSLYRRLAEHTPAPPALTRKNVQMVFCIDVRSELMRRRLESVGEAVETFGFAGFFAIPLEYVPLGASSGPAQCPVLLSPSLRIRETSLHADSAGREHACERRRTVRRERKLWKSFQTSAATCFSFVESLGLTYLAKLCADTLAIGGTPRSAGVDGDPVDGPSRLGPELAPSVDAGLAESRRIDLAENLLRGLGLTKDFARIVAFCGHECEVYNNPYKAGLDCGACGGHSGEPNARVAAALLNDPAVRAGLARRGLEVPADTWFTAAVHNTTTDEIRFPDACDRPPTHTALFDQLLGWTRTAGLLCRDERSGRLGGASQEELFRRSRDWAEVRPEWGLAGNAAFVVAPRSSSRGVDLGGRVFLHDYDARKDPEFKVLETILTAPMIVTNWINLQYYASAVDNRAFGSGDKTIHNVVGLFGVYEGNGGDLTTGLPWQCVHDGARLQHEPLRLSVIVDAPLDAVERIVRKHALVRDLASNGWLSLIVRQGDRFHRWTAEQSWRQEAYAPVA